jgi:divalent anion:Na+ symporter, DASS family
MFRYVPQTTWLRMGALLSVVNIVLWLAVGSVWWRFLGLW